MNSELLIVDDLQERREMLTEVAYEAGFQRLDIATTESEAMALIAAKQFQVAVVDIKLPEDKEGLRIIRHLREVQPDCRVIALTGEYGDEIGVEALQEGAHDFITRLAFVDFRTFLRHRLRLWRGVVASEAAEVGAGV